MSFKPSYSLPDIKVILRASVEKKDKKAIIYLIDILVSEGKRYTDQEADLIGGRLFGIVFKPLKQK